MDYKQVIIARKDLNMSPGKLAAQVAHGAMAFLNVATRQNLYRVVYSDGLKRNYKIVLPLDIDLYDNWFDKACTKVVLQAKNKSQLEKAVSMARESGMIEGKDFFLIRDECRTELTPENEDGTTFTVLAFRPMPADQIDAIGKKFHLYQ